MSDKLQFVVAHQKSHLRKPRQTEVCRTVEKEVKMANHTKYGHECEVCKPLRSTNSPLTGPTLGRRNFFKIAGAGVTGYFLSPLLKTESLAASMSAPMLDAHLVGKARNCIFILLAGAPSNTDTFDL